MKVQKTMRAGDFAEPACLFSGRHSEMVGADSVEALDTGVFQ